MCVTVYSVPLEFSFSLLVVIVPRLKPSLPPFSISSTSSSSSSMAPPPRVLLCGGVLGRLNQLFKRVATVSKSAGPFDVLLCVGQFFPDSPDRLEEFLDYTEGRSQVPIPTYFIGDYGIGAIKVLSTALNDPLNRGFKMDGLKICDNLFWLKGGGKFTLHGLNLTYLSGKHLSESKGIGTYNQDDVDALRAWAEDAGIVDLFLTNEWPSGVTNRADVSEAPPGISDPAGSNPVLSELVAEIKPRYHIAGTKGVFYAREPYSNDEAVHVTRFFGLAPVGNKDKQKFIHAISPTPAFTMSADEISGRPPNTTLSPYRGVLKTDQAKEVAKRPIDSDETQYWRYDVSKKRQRKGGEEGEKLCFKFIFSGSCPREEKCNFQHDLDAREQFLKGVCIDFLCKGKCERGPDCTFKHNLADKDDHIPQKTRRSENTGRSKDCWFCLSSPNVESHLILGIGEYYYFALAKGPLVEDHVLIIPIEHSPNTLSLEPNFEIELEKFGNSLKMYFKDQSKEVVFFEWISKHGTHANLQAIPIPLSKTPIAQRIFNLAAEKLGFKFVAMKSDNKSSEGRKLLRAQFDRKSSFFYVELPEGTILSHSVEDTEKFPAQFGREVLAGLLNMADRADWRNCKLSKEEEMEMAEGFKKRFEEFDPTRFNHK